MPEKQADPMCALGQLVLWGTLYTLIHKTQRKPKKAG